MTAQPHEPIVQTEFPAWELRQETKHEFVNGHIYGFAGGTYEHNRIAAELLGAIVARLRGSRCATFGPDMLIEMEDSTRYADVVVTCDERDQVRGSMVIRFPKLVIEVLSESTALQDQGAKMREYERIATLEEYALVDSRRRPAQVSRRQGRDWALDQPVDSGALELRSIQTTIDPDGIYETLGVPT